MNLVPAGASGEVYVAGTGPGPFSKGTSPHRIIPPQQRAEGSVGGGGGGTSPGILHSHHGGCHNNGTNLAVD